MLICLLIWINMFSISAFNENPQNEIGGDKFKNRLKKIL